MDKMCIYLAVLQNFMLTIRFQKTVKSRNCLQSSLLVVYPHVNFQGT